MRYLVFLLLCCLLEKTTSRPQAVTQDYKDADEAEYENEDSPEDSPHRDEDAAVDERANIKEEDEVMEPHHSRNYFFKHHGADRSPEERTTKENTNDNFSEFKSASRLEGPDEDPSENEQDQPVTNRRYDRQNELNNHKNQFIQALVNQKENLRNLQLIKRRDNAEQEESNDNLYEGDSNQEHVSRNDKNKRNEDTAESIGQSNYNHYYNRSPTENKESEDDPYEEINAEDANRDRRDTNDPDETINSGNAHDIKEKKDLENFENEAEQAIIQRYVKKLNKKEVENLMRTLSEDKRAILEQIISDGSNQAISLNKREITKKAEAVEENNFMDGIQSDSNKISGPLVNFNLANGITNKNNDQTGMTPAIEENVSSTISGENKINRRSNEEGVSEKSENGAVTSSSTESVTAKSENKREVNIKELNNEGSPVNSLNTNEPQESSIIGSQDEFYANSQDEDLSQLMDDDVQLHYDYRHPQKRDLMQENNENMAEPMKSLQESFSDNNNYENTGYTGDLNMMPLIRVKRKNYEHAVKKRAAAIMPDSKVAYVPENEDEDNDEGNEIYDNGFFDRTASFAKSNKRVGKVSDTRESGLKLNTDGNQSVFKRSSAEGSHVDDVARDNMSIGSDTDSVLSGVEGVNENLMYSGGCRKKRAAEEITKLVPVDDIINILPNASRSSLVSDTGRPEIFGVSFDSNDAFGSSSKTYDGELGRYKRIRRLKHPTAVKSSTTIAA
ncbi:phosphatidylinositol 3-kinase 3-like [Cydia pomonella]|uniref:phosphatidylinositol 3-kinase 3-like n=1 Tax=Cydia pomonella TaxID=82600 RepID=UPI002ADDB1AD|nr:phosphatidylinositol 3-kinase 3-like [Cydia pomonella]